MVIAAHIHSAHLPSSQLFQCLVLLAEKYPAEKFIIFSDKEALEKGGTENTEFIDIKPSAKSNLRLHYWYNYKLPSLLKKVKADIFLSDACICSLKSNIPQWLVIGNTSFLNKNGIIQFDTDPYRRKYFQKFLQVAAGVMIREEFMAKQIADKYPVAEEKFHFMGEYFFDLYKPMSREIKNEFLEKLTGGIEYFLCIGMPATKVNIIHVLKAFSLFKVRLKSGFKLVLTLQDVTLEECVKDFRLYKYRDDVIVINEYAEHTYPQLVAASYAIIYMPSEITGYSERGLSAMQSGTAVIAIDQPEHHSLYRDAALLTDADDKSIADKMMLLYKDEYLRNSCIEKGWEMSKDCTLNAMAERIWRKIQLEGIRNAW